MVKKHKKNSAIKQVLIQYVNNNLKEFIIVIVIFLIGLFIGIYLLNHLSETQLTEIDSYVSGFIDSLKNDKTIDTGNLLRNSIIENVGLTILIWFVGSTVIGLPIVYGIIAFKGFSIGYTISAIATILGPSKGMLFTISAMLLQNLIYIPCILALAVSSTKLYQSIMKDRRRENIKVEILRHTIFCAVIGVLLIISSFIEVYVSTNIFKLCIPLM